MTSVTMDPMVRNADAWKFTGYLYGRRQYQTPLPVDAGSRAELIDQIAEGWSLATRELIVSHYLITPESPREWM